MSYLTFEKPNVLKKTWKHYLARNGERWDLLLEDEELSGRRKIVGAVGSWDGTPIEDVTDDVREKLEEASEHYRELADLEFRAGACAGVFVGFEHKDGQRFVSVGALGTVTVAQKNESMFFCTCYRVTPGLGNQTSGEKSRKSFIGRALDKLRRIAEDVEDPQTRDSAVVSATLPAGVCDDAGEAREDSADIEQSTLSSEDLDQLRFLLSDYLLGLEVQAPYQQMLDTLIQGAPPAPSERVELADANGKQFAELLSNLRDVSEPVGQGK